MAQTIIEWAACPVLESVPGKMGGAWVFKGTRVPVSVVLSNVSAMSVAELAEDYPNVSREQITGLLDFIAHSVEATQQ